MWYLPYIARIARPARITPTSRSDARLPLTETDRFQWTQTIRRTECGFTERDSIQTMTKPTGVPENRLFGSVLRDPKDHRRFYLTYATMTVKRDVMSKGFFLDGIHIKPSDETIIDPVTVRKEELTAY